MLIITTRAETRTRAIRRIDLFIFAMFAYSKVVRCSSAFLRKMLGSFYTRTEERIILLLPSLDERDFIGSRHEQVSAWYFFSLYDVSIRAAVLLNRLW